MGDTGWVEAAHAWLTGGDGVTCPHCGQDAEMEIQEIYSPRQFQISACCERVQDDALEILDQRDEDSATLMRLMHIEQIMGEKVRRVMDDGCGVLVLDWKPTLCEVTQKMAKAFVTAHHRHCKAPAGWKFGLGIRNGDDLIGVAMVGRPVARMIDHTSTLEVNRLCVRRDLADGLTWNACSMLYAAAAKRARKMGFVRLITYTLDCEAGSSLKASGWIWDGTAGGGNWSCPSRPREYEGPGGRKSRWVMTLGKAARPGRPRASGNPKWQLDFDRHLAE